MNKAIFYIVVFLTTSILLLTPGISLAHVLKTDGNIGAVLHIDPDDNPVAGEQAGFYFEFKDIQGKFTPQGCDCTFSIIQGGKEIFSGSLFQNNPDPSLSGESFYFTFPVRDVYQIKVVGKPIQTDAFQPFILIYNVRVARQTSTLNANLIQGQNDRAQSAIIGWFSNLSTQLIAAIIIVVFLFLALAKQIVKTKKRDNEKPTKHSKGE